MWRSRLASLAFVAVLAVACDRAPTPTQTPAAAPNAALIENAWQPIEMDYVTCSGEVLHLVGQVRITSTERYSEAGKYQTRYQMILKLTGTGADGSRYIAMNNTSDMTNIPPTLGGEMTLRTKVKLTGKGPAANESFDFLTHGTMNANGEITNYRFDCRTRCDGITAAATTC